MCSWSHSKCIEQAHFDSWFILFRKFLPAQMWILKLRPRRWWAGLRQSSEENDRSCRITRIACKGQAGAELQLTCLGCWLLRVFQPFVSAQVPTELLFAPGMLYRRTLIKDSEVPGRQKETTCDLKPTRPMLPPWNLTPAQSSRQTLSYPLEFNHPGGGQTVPAVACSRSPCSPWFQASGRPLFPVSLLTLVSRLPINSWAANIFSVYLQASVSPSQFPNCWLQQKEPDWNTRSSEPCRGYLQRPGWGVEGRRELHTCIFLITLKTTVKVFVVLWRIKVSEFISGSIHIFWKENLRMRWNIKSSLIFIQGHVFILLGYTIVLRLESHVLRWVFWYLNKTFQCIYYIQLYVLYWVTYIILKFPSLANIFIWKTPKVSI